MSVVIDASVAIKWYIEEIDSDLAMEILAAPIPRHAPDLLLVETANILWKKVRRGDISAAAALATANAIQLAPMTIHPSRDYIDLAVQFACRTDRTVYDAIYVVLAMSLDCPLVTADEKLFNAVQALTPPVSIVLLRNWIS